MLDCPKSSVVLFWQHEYFIAPWLYYSSRFVQTGVVFTHDSQGNQLVTFFTPAQKFTSTGNETWDPRGRYSGTLTTRLKALLPG
jgi:hypothetical protein